ncbi:hypothetical protein [Streptomyces radicis]|uniref:Uncharacterized protein n=1 Tax=Streptomyces radicis TaxID=1750517 RepID=A0A3A9WD46_9ACTN|nr:hypothetical protein [Streptomyces radicis]RKN10592.1 hypothetical protein D7319_09220 [Streptomyces radicis]RKN24852.1 hypothetical protein D7318_10400 [Streptomyces radicis]
MVLDGSGPAAVAPGTVVDVACAHTLHLSRGPRLPETTRQADRLCRQAPREATPEAASGSNA